MNPEQDFIDWVERRDAHALGRVFDATAGRLLLLAAHVSGPDSPDDLVQATFLAAMTHGQTWDRTRPLWPWLATILRNEASSARRRRQRRREVGVEGADQHSVRAQSPLLEAESEEAFAAVRDSIDGLPQVYRQVIRLHVLHGLQPMEIARALELPVGTVRSQLHRGLQKLRQRLPSGVAALAALRLDVERPSQLLRERVLEDAAGFGTSLTATGLTLSAWVAMKSNWILGAAIAALLLSPVAWYGSLSPDRPEPASPTGERHSGGPPTGLVTGRDEPTETREVVPTTEGEEWELLVRVLGPDGRPRASVPVEVWTAAKAGSTWWPPQGTNQRRPVGDGLTDGDGTFGCSLEAVRSWSPLARSNCFLFVAAAGRAEAAKLLRLPRTSGPNRLETEITLRSDASWTGRVVDIGGAPIADAQIWRRQPGSRLELDERSGPDGAFSIDRDPEDPAAGLVLFATGHGIAAAPLPEAKTDLGDITLRRRGVIHGRVVLGDGSALAHFPLHLKQIDSRIANDREAVIRTLMGSNRDALGLDRDGPYVTRAETQTDADGRFSFAGLDESATYAIWVRDSILHAFSDCLEVAEAGSELEIRVERQLLMLGLRSQAGDLLPGVDLVAEGLDPARRTPAKPNGRSYTVRNAAFFGAPDGRLMLLSPFDWSWRIATADDQVIADVMTYVATSGVHRAERTLELRPELRFGDLRLHVVDENDQPIEFGYDLRLEERELSRRSMSPPRDGLVRRLPAGDWKLTLRLGDHLRYGYWGSGPGGRGRKVIDCNITDGQTTDVKVVASAAGRVVLRFLDASPTVVMNLRVRDTASGEVVGHEWTRRFDNLSIGESAANESLVILDEGYPPGEHTFVVAMPGHHDARCTVQVIADQAVETNVELRPR